MLPSLLRLLLCLCLLVDAVAPAVAATHVARAGADTAIGQEPAGSRAHADTSDCHGTDKATSPDDAPPAAPDDDCLQRCLDLCLQHGIALVPPAAPMPAVAPVRAPDARARAQVATRHDVPPLRPPIA